MDNFQIIPRQNNRQDSLSKRYFYRLISNIFGFCISLITQAIIPRGLGPKTYGDFNFLTNFFNQVIGFFDMGSSIGFYTKLSQRQKESKLVSFYFYFIGVVASLIIVFVGITHLANIYIKLWPGQRLLYIYLAALLALIIWIISIMNEITDAYGLTVPAELGKIFQKFIGLFIIVVLFIFHKLNLTNFFFCNFFLLFLLMLIFILIIRRHGYFIQQAWHLSIKEIKKYINEFYQYSHPLFLYNLVGMLTLIFDRWLLQIYGGSTEQGFFGLSYQISVVCFLFTSAMVPLIMREFSVAHGNKDLGNMAILFRKNIPLLYSITVFFSCFIAINADKVTLIMGGGKFKESTLAVAIMAFYPIHQTYGQLSGSIFYATAQTKLYRNIGIIFMLIGLPLTYFLIAPNSLFGMDAGASGLAFKMVLLQFFAVNVQLYFNAKFLKLSFLKYFAHQLINLISFLSIAIFATFIVNYTVIFYKNIILNFIISGLLYTLLVLILIYFLPMVIGLNRKDLRSCLQLIKI